MTCWGQYPRGSNAHAEGRPRSDRRNRSTRFRRHRQAFAHALEEYLSDDEIKVIQFDGPVLMEQGPPDGLGPALRHLGDLARSRGKRFEVGPDLAVTDPSPRQLFFERGPGILATAYGVKFGRRVIGACGATPLTLCPPGVTFCDTMRIDDWRRWLEIERRLALGTIEGYSSHVEALARSCDGQIDDLDAPYIRQWLNGGGGSQRTVASKHSALNSYYGFLVRHGHRDKPNPMDFIERPRPPRPVPRPTVDARRRIAELNPPYRWVAELIYETGMAIREVVAIDVRPEDIGDEITVRGRPVRLSPEAQRALRKLGGRVNKSVRAIERALAFKDLSARGLRHAFADDLAAQGEDVGTIAAALGHRSPASARVYTRGKPSERELVAAAIERRGGPHPSMDGVRKHRIFAWNGGLRCERCGRRVDGPGPTSAPECLPVRWEQGTFELRHMAGPPGSSCPRCGDPAYMNEPEGWEYVVTDSHQQDDRGHWHFYRSGRLAEQPHLESVPPCGVSWHEVGGSVEGVGTASERTQRVSGPRATVGPTLDVEGAGRG